MSAPDAASKPAQHAHDAVSVVIPSLDDRELLERHLPPLLAELARRACGDEVLVVDDTGGRVLASWLAARFEGVRVHSMSANSGFAAALLAGVQAARHELVFSMNPDVRVHAGFLEPLVAALSDARVHSAVPCVWLQGEPSQIESLTELRFERGELRLGQPGLEGRADELRGVRRAVAYAVGGSCLLRRSEFLDGGGFDPLYAPFYYEDVDLCWQAWRSGRRVVYEPASIVEHLHRGTIKRRVPADLVRAVIERNRLLFTWKHVDDPTLLAEHIAALHRVAIDALICGERDKLEWLVLALDRVAEASAARARAPSGAQSFAELLRVSAQPLPAPG